MSRFIKITLLFTFAITAIVVFHCSFRAKKSNEKPLGVVGNQKPYLLNLDNHEQFTLLASQPLQSKYNGMRTVKLVYELKSKKVYFVNGNVYRFHHDFCKDQLGFFEGIEIFNQTNYTTSSLRKFILANLNYHEELKTYVIEFVSEDEVSMEQIKILYEALNKQKGLQQHIKLLINSNYLSQKQTHLIGIPFIHPEDIYGMMNYQVLKTGTCRGKLKFIQDKDDYLHVKPEDIIVMEGSPLFIPECKAMITDQFQTPLSHIQILARQYQVPAFAYKNIRSSRFNQYANQYVELTVGIDSFVLNIIPADSAWHANRNPYLKPTNLQADLNFKHVAPLSSFHKNDKIFIGNKAMYLAMLQRVAKENKGLFFTPEGGFAIPFFYYHQHISNPNIMATIHSLLKGEETFSPAQIKEKLKIIRTGIQEASMNPQLMEQVNQRISKNKLGKRYRFRSSSNAEDVYGFSGAGLYDSKTGIQGDSVKTIEKAIKTVWASVWNFEAFMARKRAHILHQEVQMAVLCHRSFPDEEANGVVVTENIYRKSFPGFTVNVQKGDISVVNPEDGIVCDQFTMFKPSDFNPFTDDIAVDYITTGNQNNGQKTLSHEQIKQLYEAVFTCNDYMMELFYKSYAYDLEFKFDKGKLYIKQIRPFY